MNLIRFLSLSVQENPVTKLAATEAKEWLKNFAIFTIPKSSYEIKFDRSSGPGGQNVNKVSTKCTLTFHNFSNSSWLPKEIKRQLSESNKFRFYKKASDKVVIQSDQTRSRESNRELCLQKFVNEIKSVLYLPDETSQTTVRKWDSIKRKDNEIRLKRKKFESEKKKLRSKSFDY